MKTSKKVIISLFISLFSLLLLLGGCFPHTTRTMNDNNASQTIMTSDGNIDGILSIELGDIPNDENSKNDPAKYGGITSVDSIADMEEYIRYDADGVPAYLVDVFLTPKEGTMLDVNTMIFELWYDATCFDAVRFDYQEEGSTDINAINPGYRKKDGSLATAITKNMWETLTMTNLGEGHMRVSISTSVPLKHDKDDYDNEGVLITQKHPIVRIPLYPKNEAEGSDDFVYDQIEKPSTLKFTFPPGEGTVSLIADKVVEYNVELQSFQIGDPGAEPSADLTKLSLTSSDGNNHYLTWSDPSQTSITTNPIPYAVALNGLKLDYATKSPTAQVTVTGATYDKTTGMITGLKASDITDITISVKDGELSKNYVIHAEVGAKDSNTKLGGLVASHKNSSNINFGFKPEQYIDYTITVPYTITEVTLTATKANEWQTITFDGDTTETLSKVYKNLSYTSPTVAKIYVKAQDGSTSGTPYTINIVRSEPSYDTALQSVSVNSKQVSLGEDGITYSADLDENVKNFTFEAILKDAKLQSISYSLSGSEGSFTSQKPGQTTIEKGETKTIYIKVVAEDGVTNTIYELQVHRTASSLKEIESVKVQEGSTTKSLPVNSGSYEYIIQTSGENAEKTLTFTIKCKEGGYAQVYKFNGDGQYEEVVSYNDELDGAKSSVVDISELNKGRHDYVIRVYAQDLSETEYPLTIVKRSDEKELLTPVLSHVDNGQELFPSNRWETPAPFQYKINLNYKEGGVVVKNLRFDFTYSLNAKMTSTNWSELITSGVTSEGAHSYANVDLGDNKKAITFTKTVTITAENGTTQDYQITVVRGAADGTKTLSDLQIGGNQISGFGETTFIYSTPTIITGADNPSVNIKAVPKSELSTITINDEVVKEKQFDLQRGVIKDFVVKVIAENGEYAEYKFKVISANTENGISKIELINNKDNQPIAGFNFTTTTDSYHINVKYNIESVKIIASLTDSQYAKAEGAGDKHLSQGTNTFVIKGISEAGKAGIAEKTEVVYTITIEREPARMGKKLDSLSVVSVEDGAEHIESFLSTTYTYTFRVDRTINNLKISATVPEEDGSKIIAGLSDNLYIGDKSEITITITVQAENEDRQDYKITVIRKNDIDRITGISVEGHSEYTFNENLYGESNAVTLTEVSYSISQIKITSLLEDSSAKLYYTVNGTRFNGTSGAAQTIDLVANQTNTIIVYAKSEYASSSAEPSGTTRQYVIKIKRNAASNNAKLATLKVFAQGKDLFDGDGVKQFNPDEPNYNFRVNRDVTTVNIEAKAQDPNAKVLVSPTGGALTVGGTTTFTITVQPETGAAFDYHVSVKCANDIAEITNINTSDNKITNFEGSDTFDLGNVSFSTKSITLTVTAKDIPYAKVYYEVDGSAVLVASDKLSGFKVDLNAGSNTIKIYAVSEAGTKGSVYTILVYQDPANTNLFLSQLSVKAGGATGPELLVGDQAFNKEVKSYEVRVNNSINSVDITATAEGTGATVSISPSSRNLDKIENIFYIKVRSEAGGEGEYVVTVIKANDNNKIIQITVDGTSITLDSSKITEMPSVAYNVSNTKIQANLEDSSATLFGVGTFDLKDGDNIFEVYAISEYGKYKNQTKNDVDVYTIKIHRIPASKDATLTGIVIKDVTTSQVLTYTPVFEAETINYTLTIADDSPITQIDISASYPSDRTVTNLGIKTLNIGAGGVINDQFNIHVTAQDGITHKTYTINVIRAISLSNDCSVSATLKDDSGKNWLNFVESTTDYGTITLPYSINGATLKITKHEYASIEGTQEGYIAVSAGGYVDVQFRVIAQDGKTKSSTYTFRLAREKASDIATLKSLKITSNLDAPDDILLDVQEGTTVKTKYTINVTRAVTDVTIEAQKTDPNSKVLGDIGPITLTPGTTNTLKIYVSAEDGNASQVYTIEIVVKDKDYTIVDITSNPSGLNFSDSVINYPLETVAFETQTLGLDIELANANAKLYINGTIQNDPRNIVLSLTVGDNTFRVKSVAENGAESKQYTISIKRLAQVIDEDSTLNSIKINGDEYITQFVNKELTLNFEYAIKQVDIVAKTTSSNSHPGGDLGIRNLSVGNNAFMVYGITQSNVNGEPYKINIVRAAADEDNTLTKLSYDIGNGNVFDLITSDNPNQTTFNVEIADTIGQVLLAAEKPAKATIKWPNGSPTLILDPLQDTQVATIIVESEGGTPKPYTIIFKKVNDDATINSIIIDGTEKFGEFKVDNNNTYSFAVDYVKDNVAIFAKASNSKAKVTGNGSFALTAGAVNTFEVYATSEKGTKGTVYTIKVTRAAADDNCYLANLSVKNSDTGVTLDLKPTFNKNTLKYTINVAADVDNIEILATAESSLVKSIEGLGKHTLKTGDGLVGVTFKVIVEAQSGDKKSYEIFITKQADPNDDITIEDITLVGSDGVTYLGLPSNANAITKFDKNQFKYNIVVAYKTANATLSIINSNSATITGVGTFSINATGTTVREFYLVSKNGEKVSPTYTINITKEAPSEDKTLSDITIDGKPIQDFNPDDKDYVIVLPDDTEKITIGATPNDNNSKVTGTGDHELVHGDNTIKVTVEAEDGTSQDYTIVVKCVSNKCEMINLSVEDHPFVDEQNNTVTFNQEVYTYNVKVPYSVDKVNIVAIVSDYATVEGDKAGIKKLIAGQNNSFTLRAMAEDGKTIGKSYTINIYRDDVCSDNKLSTLEVRDPEGNLLAFNEGAFNPNNNEYIVQIPKDRSWNSITINATAYCHHYNENPAINHNQIIGTGPKTLKDVVGNESQNIFEVVVISEDGKTNIYKITVFSDEIVLEDDVEVGLVELKGSDGVLYLSKNPDDQPVYTFDPLKHDYVITVPAIVKSVSLIMMPASSKGGTVFGTGTQTFDSNNEVTFEVQLKSQSGKFGPKYTIVVKRTLADSDATLKDITIDGKTIDGFDKDKFKYEINVAYALDKININAITTNSSSKIISGIGNNIPLKDGRNPISIVVQAEDGTTQTYDIIINRLNVEARLNVVEIKTCPNAVYNVSEATKVEFEFAPDTFEYTLDIPKDTQTVNFYAAAVDQLAYLAGVGNFEMKVTESTFYISCTAANGQGKLQYKFNLRKAGYISDNANLSELEVAGYPIQFDPLNYTYFLTVGKNVKDVDITARAKDPNAKITFRVGDEEYKDFNEAAASAILKVESGKNAILVIVTAENGNQRAYRIIVNKDAQSNIFLIVMIILLIVLLLIVITVATIIIVKKNKEKENDGIDLQL